MVSPTSSSKSSYYPRSLSLLILLLVNLATASRAFAASNSWTPGPTKRIAFNTPPATTSTWKEHQHYQLLTSIRGGDISLSHPTPESSSTTTTSIPKKQQSMSALVALVMAGASRYSQALEKTPIITKSVTAAVIFMISDLVAQRIEGSGSDDQKLDKKRTLTASLVGLLYFGPAAHVWYDNIFRLFPGTSLFSTLQKAAMGQLIFGPSFTCVFFATSLLQSGNFSLGNWARKIKADLPGAWLSGAGFWPLVDLISYSLIPQRWIPLFINVCSLIWNVYLSMVANRKTSSSKR